MTLRTVPNSYSYVKFYVVLKFVSHHHPIKERFCSTVGKAYKERGTVSRKKLKLSQYKMLIHA